MKAGENPFRTSRVHGLPFLWPEGEGWDTLTGRWEAAGFRGALTGPHGNGKSTLLGAWVLRLREGGWEPRVWRLTEEFPCLPADFARQCRDWPVKGVAVLDGAEQMGLWDRWRWRWHTRGAAGMILTNHKTDMVPTVLRVGTTPAQLLVLLEMLLEGTGVALPPKKPEDLLHMHGGDVREVFRWLYDAVACGELSSRATSPDTREGLH